MDLTTETENLRTFLRGETADEHDKLDSGMARFDLADREDYATFLSIQLAARAPIEAWCAAHTPEDLRPPEQSSAIRADLDELGVSADGIDAAPPSSGLGEPLGVAWALGGSSLGNRAMLAHLRKRAPHGWPVRFLGDDRMRKFWSALRPRIECPVDTATARRAAASACAVFVRFEAALAAHTERKAA